MRLVPVVEPSLPPLAWCLRSRRGSDDVTLVCGTGVEVRPDAGAFFEGAWAGPFAEMGRVDEAADVFGSGGVARADHLVLVPPSHTLERIQLMRRGDEMLASNSLCFLLEAAGDELDVDYARYTADFSRIIHGLDYAVTEIPTRSGTRVSLAYFKNIRIGRDGSVAYLDKPLGHDFPSFDAYVADVATTVAAVVANAADPGRRHGTYAPLASVSTGYDSPASATFAVRAGCRHGLTFALGRGDGHRPPADDSGRRIGERLGLAVSEFDRDAYLARDDAPEAEFLATGMSGEDVIMTSFEPRLPGTVFFTGFQGGKVWDKHLPPDDRLRRKDLSGASLNEFRLRMRFVHVPVPFIGARLNAQLHRIGNAPDLAAYSVGGDYDKPIARRISESAGVPRDAFGQMKKAVSALVHLRGLDRLSPAARRDVRAFAAAAHVSPAARAAFRLDAALHAATFFNYRVLRKLKLLNYVPPVKRGVYAIHSHTPLGPLPMIWAVQKTRARYAAGARRLSAEC
jgi:hypothetical protein